MPVSVNDRVASLDALRALLALWVMIAHSVGWTIAAQGAEAIPQALQFLTQAAVRVFQPKGELNPAVLGFLVLSGYCIARSWQKSPGIVAYFTRRAFRILPIFLVGTVAGVLLFDLASSISADNTRALSGTTTINAECVLAKLTALASLVPTFHPCSYVGNAPLLTVMVEIALYLSFVPLVANKRLLTMTLAGCVIAAVLIAALSREYPVVYNWWQNSSLYAFLPLWWIGAFATNHTFSAWLWERRYILAGAWVLLTVAVHFDPTAVSAEIRKFVLAAMFAIFVVRCEAGRAQIGLPPLPYLGAAAYSIYALHAPIIYGMIVAGWSWWLSAATATVAAVATFHIIERPLDNLGHRLGYTRPPPQLRPRRG